MVGGTSRGGAALLEVAIEGPHEVDEVEAAGAGRLELCQALALGGLTPSPGLVSATVVAAEVPVVGMLRPRPGDFVYGPRELDALRRDVDLLGAAGLSGLVLGCLRRDGRVDVETTARLVERAEGIPVTFHRAFDGVPDPEAALEELIGVGVARVLTAGGRGGALANAAVLERLVARAGERIEVVVGGGVRAAHAAELARRTGARTLHAGPRREVEDGAGELGRRTTADLVAVEALARALSRA